MTVIVRSCISLVLLLCLLSELPLTEGKATCKKPKVTAKISNGVVAPKGRYPYMCAIHQHGSGIFVCGGFLIHPNWVVTAAHCVHHLDPKAAYNGFVVCGIHNQTESFDVDNEDNVRIPTRTHIHHQYQHTDFSKGFDIALLEFREGFDLPIPKLDLGRFCSFSTGQQFTALGWGAEVNRGRNSDELKQATTLEIFSRTECSYIGTDLKSHHLCAGSAQDTCTGDSGGPLLEVNRPYGRIEDGNPKKDIIIGITSFGGDQCGVGEPGVYIQLSSFSNWIVKTTKGKVKKITGKCKKDTPSEVRRHTLEEQHGEESSFTRTKIMSTAVKDDDRDLVKVLLELDVDPDGSISNGMRFLHLAATHNASGAAKVLIEYEADIDMKNRDGMTPLMLAAQHRHQAVLQVLLQNGAQQNEQDEQGYTALHHAAIVGDAAITSDLIMYGADVNMVDEEERTPLHHAALGGYAEVVRLLVEEGCADTELKSETGKTSLDIVCLASDCTSSVREEIIEYLS